MCSHCLPCELKLVKNPLQTQNHLVVACELKNCFTETAQCKQCLEHAIHIASSALINKTIVLQSGNLFKAGVYASIPAILNLRL